MARCSTALPVVVIGPADLTTTAIVTALDARELPVVRVVDTAHFRDSQNMPGIAVIDVSTRVEAMSQVAAALEAGWRVVVLGEDGGATRVAAAVTRGAEGWVSTKAPVDALVTAVREVACGRPITSDDDRAAWLAQHDRDLEAAEERARLLDRLTDREFAVLRSLERGQRAAEIAQASVVALTTVRTQIRSILQKLEVNKQEAAIELYRAAVRARTDR